MNREQEYWSLIRDLDQTPPALEGTVDRARARAKRARAGRWLGIPAATLGGIASAFVLLVNCSTPFALACGRIPLLKELAAAAAFSPSLRLAVENRYVQPLGQTQSQNGATLTLEYLIVDQGSLTLFYTLSSDGGSALDAHPQLLGADGLPLGGYLGMYSSYNEESGYRHAMFQFPDGLPEEPLSVLFQVRDTGAPNGSASISVAAPAPSDTPGGPWLDHREDARDPLLAQFTFPLEYDPTLIGPGRTLKLDRWVEVDGQRLCLDELAIRPTQMELLLSEDPANTAQLRGLTCYALDETGQRYDTPSMTYGAGVRIQLDSGYFTGAEHFTLVITSAQWQDKDRTSFTLDLSTGRADGLPEGASIQECFRQGDHVYLAIRNDRQAVRFQGTYLDPEGGTHEWGGGTAAARDQDGDGYAEELTEYLTLWDYPWDQATILLSANRISDFDPPVEVPLT